MLEDEIERIETESFRNKFPKNYLSSNFMN